MRKIAKIFQALVVLAAIGALVSLGIMALWNAIIPSVCGLAMITYWQSIQLFVLGQLLSGGFIIALLICFWSLHSIAHPHGDMRSKWMQMTDEERNEFITRRRDAILRKRFGFPNPTQSNDDAAEK